MKLVVLSDPIERTRFFRFAIVGTIGAVVDFLTFNLLSGIFGVDDVWASVFSFTTAVLSNFTWNRYWTYPDSRSKPVTRQLLAFSVVNVVGLGIRTPLFAGLSHLLEKLFSLIPFLPLSIFTPKFLANNGALATAILVVMLWNFFVNRYWTFNDVE
jgi:putative flippase GtrA